MKGVSYSKAAKRWHAYRTFNKTRYQQGGFKTEDEAMMWKHNLDKRLHEELGAELPIELRKRQRAKARAKAKAKRKQNDNV